MAQRDRFTRPEKSWILYDWANSAHSTIIVAAIFPIYFASVAGSRGDAWWAFATSAATFSMAILAPIVGAIGDYKGMKKKLFSLFLILGLSFTVIMAASDDWRWMLVGYAVSYFGFSGANLFYDSFLTDVTTPDRMDKVSAWGYSMGYIGGSTIPFILSIALIMTGDKLFPMIGLIDAGLPAADIEAAAGVLAVKIAVILTVLWWGIFSIPILRNVRQIHYIQAPPAKLVRSTLRNIILTLKHIFGDRAMLLFMVAYFFYIDGVNSVIHMATVFGASLGLDATGMILALLVTQIVAVPFAIWFSKFAARIGTINMISIAIGVYFIICIVGFTMGFGIEEKTMTVATAQMLFWVLAVMVGTCQGGIQALSRSFFVKITTGRSSYAILSIIFLFAIGGIVIMSGRKALDAAESDALMRAAADKKRDVTT